MQQISWWRTSFGEPEIERISKAIHSEHISQGPVTEEFERALARRLGVPHVVCTTSGSMALLMGLLAAGIGPGDEVIVPNRTWIATAHAVLMTGAKPVLVDVEPSRPMMDLSLVEARITPRTKAVMPVHLNGRSVDPVALGALAEAHGLAVIEDAAQALGSSRDGQPLGTGSLAGCFSLSVAKIISTGQGGFVVTRDDAMAAALRGLRSHGVTDVVHATFSGFGFNFRFNDVLSSIGLAQLDRLDERIAHVTQVHRRYSDGLSGLDSIRVLPADFDGGEVPVYVEALAGDRDDLEAFLLRHDIGVRPFYPDLDTAVHLADGCEYPRSRLFGEHGVFLPCGPEQPLENVDRVIQVLHEYDIARGRS